MIMGILLLFFRTVTCLSRVLFILFKIHEKSTIKRVRLKEKIFVISQEAKEEKMKASLE